MVPEAPMEDRPGGKKPAGEGWFVINARDAAWIHNEKFGAGVTFEGEPEFSQCGINIQVMWPGQPNGYYHGEQGQEDFLIVRASACSWSRGRSAACVPGTSSTARRGRSTSSSAQATGPACSWESVRATPGTASAIRCPSSRCATRPGRRRRQPPEGWPTPGSPRHHPAPTPTGCSRISAHPGGDHPDIGRRTR